MTDELDRCTCAPDGVKEGIRAQRFRWLHSVDCPLHEDADLGVPAYLRIDLMKTIDLDAAAQALALAPDDTYLHPLDVGFVPLNPVPPDRWRVLDDINAERLRQDEQWGGPSHDDDLDPFEWMMLLTKHVGRAAERVAELGQRMTEAEAATRPIVRAAVGQQVAEAKARLRAQLIVISALCVACVESMDRIEY